MGQDAEPPTTPRRPTPRRAAPRRALDDDSGPAAAVATPTTPPTAGAEPFRHGAMEGFLASAEEPETPELVDQVEGTPPAAEPVVVVARRARRALDEPWDETQHQDQAQPAQQPAAAAGRRARLDDAEASAAGPAPADAAAARTTSPTQKKAGGGSLAGKAASGARVTLMGQLVRFVVQIGGLVLMSRLLTPAEVGLVAMVTAITNVAEIIRDFGLSSAAVQAKDITHQESSNLFWVNIGIGTACAVVVAASSSLIADFYGEPRVRNIALALAGIFIMSGANTQLRADLSRTMRFTALAISDVLSQVIAVAVSLFAAWQGASYWSMVIQQAMVVFISLVANAIQCRWIPSRYDRSTSIQRFVTYGRSVLGTNLMGYALNNVDNIGLSYAWGKEVVGLYSRAFNLLQQPMTQINAPLGRVALPVLSKVQQDRKELQRYFTPFQRAVCYVLGLMFGLMAALGDPLVRIMLGDKWQAAGPILAILAIGGVFKVMDSANYQIWLATGLTGKLMRFYLLTRPVMMVIILCGVPWGGIGVAISGTVAAFLNWTIATGYVCRLAGLQAAPLYRVACTSLLGVVLPASLVAWLVQRLFSEAFTALLVGGVAGVATVALVGLVVPAVRRDLLQVVRLSTMRKRA